MLLNKVSREKKDYNLLLICLAKMDGSMPWLSVGTKITPFFKIAYVYIAFHIILTLRNIFFYNVRTYYYELI